MLCVLVFVNFGHAFVNGHGNRLYKSCFYDCGETGGTNGQWYDRRYVVSPAYTCPQKFVEA